MREDENWNGLARENGRLGFMQCRGYWALCEGGGHVLDQRGDEQKTGLLCLESLGQVWLGEVA